MAEDFSAGQATRHLWDQVAPVIQKIEALPFLNELAQGTLDPAAFTHYIVQDGLYLAGYARAMSLLAAKAARRDDARFWAQSSAHAIAVEEGMHAELLADPRLAPACRQLSLGVAPPQPSPTTLGYVSYLIASAATETYAVGVAGVLPCFWVYAHVGKLLYARAQAALAAGHPYGTWVAAYDSPAFDESTRHAVRILEQELQAAGPDDAAAMARVFHQACVYEWRFWATAHERQGWQLNS